MNVLRFLPVVLGLLFTGCVSYRVNHDYDRQAPYASYKTFDWYAASRYAKDKAQGVENAIMDRRVKHAVEKELAARGYKLDSGATPDFLVTYYPIYQERRVRTATHLGWGWGFRPFLGGVGTTISQVHHYKEGTIVLEIVDYKSNQLVWQAVAEGALTGLEDPEDADEVVSGAVKRMLDRFPPPQAR